MRHCLLTLACVFIVTSLLGQSTFTTKEAKISFFSSAPFEDIEASTNKGSGGIDLQTNQVLFIVPTKTFVFKKSLMKRHFNDKYIESHLYPHAKFEGYLTSPIDTSVRTIQTLKIEGDFTIHGITRSITEEISLTYHGSHITAQSSFSVKTKDYKIKIPRIFIKNIAEEISISIETNLISHE